MDDADSHDEDDDDIPDGSCHKLLSLFLADRVQRGLDMSLVPAVPIEELPYLFMGESALAMLADVVLK